MALPTIDRDNFRAVAGEVIAASSGLFDWPALLQCYGWNGVDWRVGFNARAAMHRQLAKATGRTCFPDAAAGS